MQIRKTNSKLYRNVNEYSFEILRVVNNLSMDVKFDKVLVDCSREYFHKDFGLEIEFIKRLLCRTTVWFL